MDCPEEKVQLIEKETEETGETKGTKESKEPEEKKQTKKKKKKKRCKECNCKLSLIFYTCKCKDIFCNKHLNPHSHNCQFNYVEEKKKQIEKNNPKIGSKIKESI